MYSSNYQILLTEKWNSIISSSQMMKVWVYVVRGLLKYDITNTKFMSILLYNTSYSLISNVLLTSNIKSKHLYVRLFWIWEIFVDTSQAIYDPSSKISSFLPSNYSHSSIRKGLTDCKMKMSTLASDQLAVWLSVQYFVFLASNAVLHGVTFLLLPATCPQFKTGSNRLKSI